jgi:hypothetical protein
MNTVSSQESLTKTLLRFTKIELNVMFYNTKKTKIQRIALLLILGIICSQLSSITYGGSQSYADIQPAFEWSKNVEWSKTYEGSYGNSIIQNDDGGFTITGAAETEGEVVLLKIDASGDEQWRKNIPGRCSYHPPPFIAQMDDGGYVTLQSCYAQPAFLVKTDAQGTVQWNKTIISSSVLSADHGNIGGDVHGIQTIDNGFAVLGITITNSLHLVKTDLNGNVQFNVTHDDAGFEVRDFIQTSDEGFLLGGIGNIEKSSGYGGFLLLKLDSKGSISWIKQYLEGRISAVSECSDGGYIFVGSEQKGPTDQTWFVKVDPEGNMEWSKKATHVDDQAISWFSSVIQTRNGDFIAAGSWASSSFAWLVKMSSSGELLWSSVYGGLDEGSFRAEDIIETNDGGFAFVGNAIDGRIWVVKIKTFPDDYRDETDLLPSEWDRTYGTYIGASVIQTEDGGYAVGGQNATLGPYVRGSGRSYVNHTALLLKIDSNGHERWRKTYENIRFDYVHNLVQTEDGGYALMGYSDKIVETQRVFMLVKTDSMGNVEWNQTYQGDSYLWLTSAIQTSDGGFVMAGWEELSNDKIFALLFKIDEAGNLQWNQTYDKDYGHNPCIIEADDGGLLMAYKLEDIAQLVKIDSNGNTQWTQTYPDSWLTPLCLAKSADKGYLIAGTREVRNRYREIAWMIKTDENGFIQWQKAIVMDGDDDYAYHPGRFTEAVPTGDRGFVLLAASPRMYPCWVLKIDSSGNLEWSQRFLTTTGRHSALSVLVTDDNGLILAGKRVRQLTYDENFVWLAKIAPIITAEPPQPTQNSTSTQDSASTQDSSLPPSIYDFAIVVAGSITIVATVTYLLRKRRSQPKQPNS